MLGRVGALVALCSCSVRRADAWRLSLPRAPVGRLFATPSSDTEVVDMGDWLQTSPIFDFAAAKRETTLACFEDISDPIMGGLSSAKLMDTGDEEAVAWRGIVRTAGGGFCGMRTLPLTQPLDLSSYAGMFITCRLASDKDADQRVWKMVLRTKAGDRGEVVYQAPFTINPDIDGLQRILVPFSSFQLVRGPRIVPGAPKLDATLASNIYQVGLSVSKFQIAENMTELPKFREGFFQLDVGRIGAYNLGTSEAMESGPAVAQPDTLTAEEAKQKRPVAFKVLAPVLNLFFGLNVRRGNRAGVVLTEAGWRTGKIVALGVRVRRRRGQNPVRAHATALVVPLRQRVVKPVVFGFFRVVSFLPRQIVKQRKRKAGKAALPELAPSKA